MERQRTKDFHCCCELALSSELEILSRQSNAELLSFVKNLTVHSVRQVFFDAHMLMSAVGAKDEQLTMKVMNSIRDYVRYGVQLFCQAPSSPLPSLPSAPPPLLPLPSPTPPFLSPLPSFPTCFSYSSGSLRSLWSPLNSFLP